MFSLDISYWIIGISCLIVAVLVKILYLDGEATNSNLNKDLLDFFSELRNRLQRSFNILLNRSPPVILPSMMPSIDDELLIYESRNISIGTNNIPIVATDFINFRDFARDDLNSRQFRVGTREETILFLNLSDYIEEIVFSSILAELISSKKLDHLNIDFSDKRLIEHFEYIKTQIEFIIRGCTIIGDIVIFQEKNVTNAFDYSIIFIKGQDSNIRRYIDHFIESKMYRYIIEYENIKQYDKRSWEQRATNYKMSINNKVNRIKIY